MATAVFIQQGAVIDHTPVADIEPGAVVVQGELVSVARLAIKAGRLGGLAVEGVFSFPKAVGVGTALTTGADVFWDVAAQEATTNDAVGANKKIGRVVKDAGDNDTTVRIRMSQ